MIPSKTATDHTPARPPALQQFVGLPGAVPAFSDAESDNGDQPATAPRRRSLIVCVLIGLGYILARALGDNGSWSGLPTVSVNASWWFAAAPLALIFAALTKGRRCTLALALSVVLLAGGWFTLRIYQLPENSLAHLLSTDPLAEAQLVGVTGMVEDWPRAADPPGGALARFFRHEPASDLSLRVWRRIDPERQPAQAPCSGRLRVRIAAPLSTMPDWLRPGAVISVRGRATAVKRSMNPGEPDWSLIAAQDQIVGSLAVPSADLLARAEPASILEHISVAASAAQGWLHASATKALANTDPRALAGDQQPLAPASAEIASSDQARALLAAMLLGSYDTALEPVSAAFQRTGLVHLVAISGFNLAVMGLVVLFLLRLTGDRGWLEPALLATVIIGYMLVLPAQSSILRSGMLVLAVLLSQAAGRRYHHASVLGWVAAALLIFKPMDLWSLGFQLSVGIVAVLLVFGDQTHAALWGRPIRGLLRDTVPPGPVPLLSTRSLKTAGSWMSRGFKSNITASLLAWSVAAPIIAWSTGVFSPLAPIAGLVALPLSVVVLWAGYIALFLGALVPALARITGVVLDVLARLMIQLVMVFDRLPGASFQLQAISLPLAAAAAALALWTFHRLGRAAPHGPRRWRGRWRMALALVCLWAFGELWLIPRLRPGPALRIDAIAVGDGSCHLIRSGNDSMLFDCGSLRSSVGQRLIPISLHTLGATHIPTVIISHTNLDHFAALLDIAPRFGVQRVLCSPQMLATTPDTSPATYAFIAALRSMNIRVDPISAGDGFPFGEAAVRVLWPTPQTRTRDANDLSLVVQFSVNTGGGERRLLMTGDASREALPILITRDNAQADLRADILEVPHHGARHPAAEAFVNLVHPRVVIQSTGPRRARDQSWPVQNAPDPANRQWWITARDGAIFAEVNRDGTVRSGAVNAPP